MAQPNDAFIVVVHSRERIIEVRYPARPTPQSFARYDAEIRAAITAMADVWDCLVDQTALRALAPEFTPLVAELNRWASSKGMRRTARVIADSAIGELQGQRILRDGGVTSSGNLYKTRDDAWRALTAK